MKTATLIALFACSGCLGLSSPSLSVGGEDAAPLDPACADYDAAYIGFTAAASISSGLSGAAGVALATWPDPTRDELIGVGATGAGLGVLGATFNLLASMYAQRWAERCGGN